MAVDDDFESLRSAYARAWEVREQDDATAVLIEQLDSLQSEVFSGPGQGRDLILGLWERRVPPDALREEILRTMPRLAWKALTAMGRATVEVVRQFPPFAEPDERPEQQGRPPNA